MPAAITTLQTSDLVYAKGYVNADTAAGTKGLTQEDSAGITFNGSNTYTVVTKGLYYIRAEQLMNDGGAVYLAINVNGVTDRYAYIGGTMADMPVAETKVLNVGDTITISQVNAADNAWSGQHSSYQIIMLQMMA